MLVWKITAVILILSCGIHKTQQKAPKIEILSWLETDEYLWKEKQDLDLQGITFNDSVFIIPGDIIGLMVNCNASYPIEWEFKPDENLDFKLMLYSMQIISRRNVQALDKRDTFTYSMLLLLHGNSNAFTGKYTCKPVDQDGVHFGEDSESSIYLFWEGNSPPYLLEAGKTYNISVGDDGYVKLPCKVSLPDPTVYFEKKVNITIENGNETDYKYDYQPVGVDSNYSTLPMPFYDPQVGFVIDTSTLNASEYLGEYKCFTEQMNDAVLINVVKDPVIHPDPNFEMMMGHSSYDFLEDTQEIKCCSNSNYPPKILVLFCDNVVYCKNIRPALYTELLTKYAMSSRSDDNGCAYQHMYAQFGIFRCFGDGIDVTREIFGSFDYLENGTIHRKTYFSWDHIKDAEKLLQLGMDLVNPNPSYEIIRPMYRKRSPRRMATRRSIGYPNPALPSPPLNTQLYSTQNVSIYCAGSPFYFSHGFRLKISYKNKTEMLLPIPPQPSSVWSPFTPDPNVYVIVDSSMDSVTCYGPVWNSYDWIKKSIPVNAKDPILPSITTPDSTEIYWTLNDTDKTITCIGSGDPMPKLVWMKHGKIILEDKNVHFESTNNSILIRFSIADHDVHGQYICKATNLIGSTEQIFDVFLEEGHPWGATIAVICMILALSGIIGILGWRIKVNRQTASNLRNRMNGEDD